MALVWCLDQQTLRTLWSWHPIAILGGCGDEDLLATIGLLVASQSMPQQPIQISISLPLLRPDTWRGANISCLGGPCAIDETALHSKKKASREDSTMYIFMKRALENWQSPRLQWATSAHCTISHIQFNSFQTCSLPLPFLRKKDFWKLERIKTVCKRFPTRFKVYLKIWYPTMILGLCFLRRKKGPAKQQRQPHGKLWSH